MPSDKGTGTGSGGYGTGYGSGGVKGPKTQPTKKQKK